MDRKQSTPSNLPGSHPRAPGPVRWIVGTLEDEGFETWAVGGAVRDALLGHRGGDWDLATRARPADVRRIFRRTVPIGIEHGTVGVLDRSGVLHEVTTFRRDVETFGRKARVEFADSIEEDLARRDFTVNALAWHPLREELRDPYGGVRDLEAGILRTVGTPEERFREDYLRVLRALRFAGRFSLRIHEETWLALCLSVGRLDHLSAERIREELVKVLEGREPPSGALGLYAASGVLAELYPELETTVEHPRTETDGGTGTVWEHALLTVDTLPPGRVKLRLAALLHGVGGPATVPGHEDEDQNLTVPERAARRAGAVLSRLRFSNATVHTVSSLVEAGITPPDPEADSAELRRWLARHGPERLPSLTRLWVASARVQRRRDPGDAGAHRVAERAVAAWRRLRKQLAADPPLEESDLALDGRDLIRMGLEPGPHFGDILEHLLDRVLEDPDLNEKETLAGLVEEYLEEHPEAHRG